jgi:hypothetical protein
MKTRFLLAAMAAFAMFAFASCEKTGNENNATTPEKTFAEMFPNAYDVDWNTVNGYEVAEFMMGATTTRAGKDNYDDENGEDRRGQAWFTPTGGWTMTETDIRYQDLPQAVRTTFEASAYATWHVDDVDMIQTYDAATIYVIDVENFETGVEYDLYFTADGILYKEVLDDTDGCDDHYDNPNNPNNPNPGQGTWVESDMRYADLPQAVKTAFETGQYAAWIVDDVDKWTNTVTNEIQYQLDIESNHEERDLFYAEDGTLLKDIPDDGNHHGDNGNGNPPSGGDDTKTIIMGIVETMYPGAIITEWDTEHNGWELEVVYENSQFSRKKMDVMFSSVPEWQWTEIEDIYSSEVPQVVLDALAASEWGTWRKDDISYVETAAYGDYFEFEMESSNDREKTVRIKTDGTIL